MLDDEQSVPQFKPTLGLSATLWCCRSHALRAPPSLIPTLTVADTCPALHRRFVSIHKNNRLSTHANFFFVCQETKAGASMPSSLR